ncbi:MAG: 4-hydroxy-tetrahydrodipicolinate synthase [Kiritimatiellae bacterium]|jgi:4-hydroxy-tetrahydrodipicolinate synthase|nr:4-hydroxy-tetrahydrodipicolinate synthase [Kiritimatiellia bacterium]
MTLSGTYTAIITPFNEDLSVDYVALHQLVSWQIENGVEGLVPVGTTGESPTLEPSEHLKVISTVVEAAAGRVQIIAGTGANSTSEALQLTKEVLNMGVDATLQVTPYYNKPSDEGLFRHFSAIADLGLPVVLYNVPGRSAREIPISVVQRLASHSHIIAVKEAGGSVDRVSAIRNVCDLTVLSGDDSLTLPMVSVGASGVISVAANVIPKEMSALVRLALAGDFTKALEMHRAYYQLFNDMFVETNPIPVKAAMAMMGLVSETYRLPLCELTPESRQTLSHTLQSAGLI